MSDILAQFKMNDTIIKVEQNPRLNKLALEITNFIFTYIDGDKDIIHDEFKLVIQALSEAADLYYNNLKAGK